MPKSVREDYVTLKALLPIAQHIIEAAGAAERILTLAASGDNLAARKDQLAKEVATVLAELEEAKRQRDQVVADRDAARKQYDEEQTAYAARLNQMTAEHAEGLGKAEQESAAKLAEEAQRHALQVGKAKAVYSALTSENEALVARRKTLKDEIDQLVAKFR